MRLYSNNKSRVPVKDAKRWWIPSSADLTPQMAFVIATLRALKKHCPDIVKPLGHRTPYVLRAFPCRINVFLMRGIHDLIEFGP